MVGHFWPGRLPGGYIGVDVFFVISGFLISSHLLRELESTGRVRLRKFYTRRAKRLLPAAVLVSMASLIAVVVLMPVGRWLDAALETFAATVYVENWVLAAKSVDYSAHNDAASTVQHYWSLSVEEQFYLLWPLLLMGAFVVGRSRSGSRRWIVWTIVVVAALSFAFAVWMTGYDRAQSYFVTPTRVWEFAAGAIVGMVVARTRSRAVGRVSRVGVAMQVAGFAALAFAAIRFDQTTAFPGPMALVPVAATALVILAGTLWPQNADLVVLRPRLVQYTGDISYSLYLWHWPLLLLAPWALSREVGTVDKLVLLALCFALAALTKRFVEDPGRTRLLPKASGRRVAGVFVASTAVVGLVCVAVGIGAQFVQDRQAAELRALQGSECFGAGALSSSAECGDPFGPPEVADVTEDEAPWMTARECRPHEDPITVDGADYLNVCDFSEGRPDAPEVWLVGDSHAEQWKAAIYDIAREYDWVILESLKGGCPIADAPRVAFNGTLTPSPDLQQQCREWSAALTERISSEEPDLVLASAFGAGETIDDGSGRSQLAQYESALLSRVNLWTAASDHVVAIRDTPLTLGHSTPDCVVLNEQSPLECANPRDAALPPDPSSAAFAADPAARVVDMSDQFCDEELCYAVIGGLNVFYDTDHVARSYTRSMTPVLVERLQASIGMPLDALRRE